MCTDRWGPLSATTSTESTDLSWTSSTVLYSSGAAPCIFSGSLRRFLLSGGGATPSAAAELSRVSFFATLIPFAPISWICDLTPVWNLGAVGLNEMERGEGSDSNR